MDLLDEQGYYVESAEKWLMDLGVRKTDENGIELWAANKIIAKMLLERVSYIVLNTLNTNIHLIHVRSSVLFTEHFQKAGSSM